MSLLLKVFFIDRGDEELYRSTEHCCIVTVNKAALFDLFEGNATGKCCPRESAVGNDCI